MHEMLPKIVKFSLIMVFAMIIVITMRITLPTILSLKEHLYFRSMKVIVIKVYISLTAAILLEMLVIYLSISLIYLTSEWIIAVYIPLLVYSSYRTFKTFVCRLAYRISDKEAKQFLTDHWHNFVEHGNEFWIEIQRKLKCCGLDGPRTYLDYLRRVHKSCYDNQTEEGELIKIGCNDVVYDQFQAVRLLAIALCWFVLLVQFIMLAIYSIFLLKKSRKLRFLRTRKRKSRNNFILRSFNRN
ncbi:uncharacterized protein LOC117563422 isoform X1 [Drosophila albomicans]|uniref:Uncharacterized protein LOC117563422 isoform X1 n=1 Tax=Drosophila albomicans TaxID=7291 RepID=A0A6P8WEF7_DROAB|nr:uncharacterized protein LOC117563422 isoform X1 [Drosophila albomicans]